MQVDPSRERVMAKAPKSLGAFFLNSIYRLSCLRGGRHTSGFVQNAPRSRSRLAGVADLLGEMTTHPRNVTSRPHDASRLNTSARVPSPCHCSNRRRHVGGDGYLPGSFDHPSPVDSNQSTPFITARESTRGRPRRSFLIGSSQSSAPITSHSASLKSSNGIMWYLES